MLLPHHTTNDEVAYNDMYLKYNGIVKAEANKLYRKCKYLGISKDDIYQAGLYGLTQAINNFDEYEGVLFYTYVLSFINREMQTFIRDRSRVKHNILSDSISLDKEIDSDGNTFSLYIGGETDTYKCYEEYINSKRILDLKYEMPFLCSLVFEMRLNNFSNKEISILLDTKYKVVDNALMKIKYMLKKELNKIELS